MTSEFAWDDLLELIEDRKVIPVIGEQLLQIDHDGHKQPLYHYLADRLAERLGLDANKLPSPAGLNDLFCAHLAAGRASSDIYPKIRPILKEAQFDPPPALLQLAAIEHFGLYVSLSFDKLLANAVNLARFDGQPRTMELAYTPNGRDRSPGENGLAEGYDDLPLGWKKAGHTVVFQLLGRLSASPDYVVSDEDLLEFVHSLQYPDRRPQRLFDELAQQNLLFIGCRYADWLTRFLLRLAKGKPLSSARHSMEILVDRSLAGDHDLVIFCNRFSNNTRLLAMPADEFVAELSRRWHRQHPPTTSAPAAKTDAVPDMPEGALFISYASEDRAIARKLHDGLKAADFDVWLDNDKLEAGDLWDRKIRRHVQNCSLFLPLVSANTERRTEGYFRKEWHWAAERTASIAHGIPFILPIQLDATLQAEQTLVPDEFLKAQWTTLPNGEPTPAFQTKLRELTRGWWKSRRA